MGERIKGVVEKEYNGVKYRSTLEADTAEILDKLGIKFEYEARKLTLIPSFHSPFQKNAVRALTYTPDFIIGNIILECKGFETPEWKIKKKLVFKYLQSHEPDTKFYQVHNTRSALLDVLDENWLYMGFAVRVVSKKLNKQTKQPVVDNIYSSVKEAMEDLNLIGKPTGGIIRSLIGAAKYIYGYDWKLKKIEV